MSDKLSLCAITCTGYLTQKPENTQRGIKFPLIVTLWADGNMVNEEFEVTYNSKQAERLKQWLDVDRRVIISGSLQISPTGNLAVYASQLELLGKRFVKGAAQGYKGYRTQSEADEEQRFPDVEDEDIAF